MGGRFSFLGVHHCGEPQGFMGEGGTMTSACSFAEVGDPPASAKVAMRWECGGGGWGEGDGGPSGMTWVLFTQLEA